jgi:hypothetical protein
MDLPSCPGCFPIFQGNQLAHTEPGGCLYVDEDAFCQENHWAHKDSDGFIRVDQEAYIKMVSETDTVDEVKSESSTSEVSGFDSIGTGTECCICYEIIGKKNNCVTECGHVFCFKCLAMAMARNNSCPCCRAQLVDEPEDEDEDDESEYEDDDDDDSQASDGDDEVYIVNKEYDGNIEDIVERMESKGITMLDVVSLLFEKFSKKDEKYTNEYVKNLCEMVNQINEDNENETNELEQMGGEDTLILSRLGESVIDLEVEFVE